MDSLLKRWWDEEEESDDDDLFVGVALRTTSIVIRNCWRSSSRCIKRSRINRHMSSSETILSSICGPSIVLGSYNWVSTICNCISVSTCVEFVVVAMQWLILCLCNWHIWILMWYVLFCQSKCMSLVILKFGVMVFLQSPDKIQIVHCYTFRLPSKIQLNKIRAVTWSIRDQNSILSTSQL